MVQIGQLPLRSTPTLRSKKPVYGKRWKRFTVFLASLVVILPTVVVYLVFALQLGSESGTPAADSAHPPIPQSLSASNSKALPQMNKALSQGNNKLPRWIEDYFQWHRKIRDKYPGKKLLTDPSAPGVIIRICLGLCGGLHDRLGQLPWDIYLANQTQRVFLIHWERPKPLENFLLPTGTIDWRVPPDMDGLGDMHALRKLDYFFEDMFEDRPEEKFWETDVDEAIQRANTGAFKDTKILRHRLLGHIGEEHLEARLRALGETDMLHDTTSFGNLFRAFFRPSDGVQAELDVIYKELNLSPGKYTGVHCRVRHPKATPKGVNVLGKNENYPADKTGLPWQGEMKDFAVSVATHAINCAKSLSSGPSEPMYFFSDSNDLAQYVVHDLKSPAFVKGNATLFKNKVDASALEAVRPIPLVTREQSMENAHIDRQKGRDPPAYYATFVDLYLAINARCITFGVGYYAVFATKISGIQCKLTYQEELWGASGSKGVEVCKGDIMIPKKGTVS